MCTDQTTQDTQHAVMAGVLESGGVAMERNRYFTGKYMSARDFADEQAYHISRQRLHSRLLHGWGVVCGLRVVPHPNHPRCQGWAVVRAGVAIDCYGRDVVLREDTALDLTPLLPERPAATSGGATGARAAGPPAAEAEQAAEEAPPALPLAPKAAWLVLGARYREVPCEHVPALYDEGMCDPTRHEANRIREVTELKLYRLEQFAPFPHHWPGTVWHRADEPRGAGEAEQPAPGCKDCRKDCDDDVPGPAGLCLEPECLLDQVVPLAIIKPTAGDEATWWVADMAGRPELARPPEFLTRIVAHNWPHGGPVTLAQLKAWDGKLRVRFNRPIKPRVEGAEGTGVSEFTFVVQYYEGGQQRDVELVPQTGGPETNPHDHCEAVVTLDKDIYERVARGRSRETLPINTRIYITLKCDYILDCHDTPVDGNYLRGTLPTGDGVPGGTFESWFWIGEESPAATGRPA